MSSKQIMFEDKALLEMKKGVDKIADVEQTYSRTS